MKCKLKKSQKSQITSTGKFLVASSILLSLKLTTLQKFLYHKKLLHVFVCLCLKVKNGPHFKCLFSITKK